MAVNLSFIGGAGWQFFTDDGVPLSGGKIYTYVAGTTTPQVTYTSRDGVTPNSNPIILDAAGRTPQQIWSTEGVLYKYVVKDANDVLIRTWDNIGGSVVASDLAQDLANTTSNAKGDALIGFRQSDANGFMLGSVGRTVNNKLQEIVSLEDFGAVGDGLVDDAAAISSALASSAGSINLDSLTYAVTTGNFSLQDKELRGTVNSTIKGVSGALLFAADGAVKVSGVAFDTYSSALNNVTATDPAVTLDIDSSVFKNGALSGVNVSAPIASAQISGSLFSENKGPSIRFGSNVYSLQAGWGPVSVTYNVINNVSSPGTASTVGGVLSYAPYSKIIGNDIRNVTGGVGDETFGVYVKSKYAAIAFNNIENVTSTGVTLYGINLKGSDSTSTDSPQGHGAMAIGNVVAGGNSVTGLQMQADQQSAIGNFFVGVLAGIEQGSAVLSDNLVLGNRTKSSGGVASRGVTASVDAGERLIDAYGIHSNVRIGVRYVTTGTNAIDRLLIAGQHLESDAAPGAQGVIVQAGTPGKITNVTVRDITTKNHSRAVDFVGVYGGIIENIRATGLITPTRPFSITDCKNVVGLNVWEYSVQTTDNTPTFVYDMNISNGNLLTIKAKCFARKSDGTSEAHIEQSFLFKQESGVASIVASGTPVKLGSGAVGGLTAAITSNRPAIRVTGVSAETWDWTVWIDFDLK
jgi:hypothetical protein